jgi:hypothetical protein
MRHIIAAAAAMPFFLAIPVSAQVLYNNGAVRGGDGAFGITTNPGAGFNGSDASQANPDYAYGASAPQFADDFVLSSNSSISSFTLYSYVPNSTILTSPILSTTINIWNGQPGSGASIIATSSNQVSSVFSNVYRTRSGSGDAGLTGTVRPVFETTVAFNGLSLSAGNYWFSFSQTGTGAVNVAGLSRLVNNEPQLVPGNALAFDAGQLNPWIPLYIARRDATASIQPDLPFLINGTVQEAPEPGSLLLAVLPAMGCLAVRYRRRSRAVRISL